LISPLATYVFYKKSLEKFGLIF